MTTHLEEQLHLATNLKAHGHYSQAANILENIVKTSPDCAPALNNLGTLYYAQAKIDEAISLYRRAITKQPDYADAYYNLGLAFSKKHLWKEATSTYITLLEIKSDLFAARFHLACALMNQDEMTAAITEFLKIAEAHPYHVETQINLATAYLKQGLLSSAKYHYEKALTLTPNDSQVLFNLGIIMLQQGHVDAAIQFYQRTIQADPDHFAAYNNLGVAFLGKQHIAFALKYFKEALRIQPHNQAIAYTVSMLEQNERLYAAPTDYIKTLFNAYADHYDLHLLKNLDYQLPQVFGEIIGATLKEPKAALHSLDIGCGTGLCAPILKPYAKTLTGVDLSEKMLELAKQKNNYDELIADNFLTFLQTKQAHYDLIVAADVFVYIGDLHASFQAIKSALRPNGLLVFNTEIDAELNEYTMNQSGRFLHSKNYLETLAAHYHFQTISYEIAVTRTQNGEPVYGHIYMLQI